MPAPPVNGGTAPAAAEGGITTEAVSELAEIGCTRAEAAAWLGLEPAAFRRLLGDPALGAAWKRGAARGRVRVRRLQFALAEKNATMAVFLGKAVLGQAGEAGAEGRGALTVLVDTGIDRGAEAEDEG